MRAVETGSGQLIVSLAGGYNPLMLANGNRPAAMRLMRKSFMRRPMPIFRLQKHVNRHLDPPPMHGVSKIRNGTRQGRKRAAMRTQF
jgi:hypothetical protein